MTTEKMAPNTRFMSVVVGQYIKITRPDGYPSLGYAASGANNIIGSFKMLYPERGTFISGGENQCIYRHDQPGRQVIEYISSHLGITKFSLVLEGIQVHDHGSISMGGPAFATYYSEPSSTIQEGD